MLDRAHQLLAEGVDVVVGFVETHGRKETAALLDGLEIIPPKIVSANGITYREFDRDALIARKPQVALIDELAHTNAPGSIAPKRFYDVLAVLRAGIDVITTLNIQHLEGLGDTVLRLTGTIVRETLPDGILSLADEVILIDVTPETLRQRLREGKIYPPERCETALANFFRTENLFALRELALREALRARHRERIASPFERILLASRLARRRSADDPARRTHRGTPRHRIRHRARRRRRAHASIQRSSMRCAPRPARPTSNGSTKSPTTCRSRLIEIARARVPKRRSRSPASATTPALAWQRPSFPRRLLDAGARELLVLLPPDRSPVRPHRPKSSYCGFEAVRARDSSSSTLTRGSPRKPNVLPCTCCRDERVDRGDASCGAPSPRAAPPSTPLAGVMSGSMPLPLDVTRSIGGGPLASGFSFFSCAIVAFVESMSFFEVGP